MDPEELVFKLRNEVSPELAKINRDVATVDSSFKKAAQSMSASSDAVVKGMSSAGKEATAASKMIAGMGQSGREAMARLGAETQAATSKASAFSSVLGGIQKQIVAAFAVGTIVNFGKSLGEYAGRFVNLNAETQIGIERLQAWNYVLAGADLKVEDMAAATEQLAKRLAGGDDSAAAAVERLGMRVGDLQGLGLEQSFIKIGEAVSKVEDPMERIRIATELYGKSGAQMLRVMTGDMEDLVKAAEDAGAVIDEELIKQADEFDAAWDRALLRFKANSLSIISAVASAMRSLSPSELGPRTATSPGGNMIGGKVFTGAPADFVPEMIQEDINAFVAQAAGRKGPHIGGSPFMAMLPTDKDIDDLSKQSEKAKKAIVEEVRGLSDGMLAAFNAAVSSPVTSQFVGLLEGFAGARRTGGGLLTAASTGGLTQMAQYGYPIGTGAIRGDDGRRPGAAARGPSFLGGVGGGLSSMWQGMSGGNGFGGLMSNIGGGLVNNLFSGGIGSLISMGMSGVGKLFGKLFKSEGRATNDARDLEFGKMGGYDAVAGKAAQAGATMNAVLDAKTVKDFEAAWKDLTAAIDEQQAVLDKYNVTWLDFKGAEQTKRLGEDIKNVSKEYDALIRAGLDHETATKKVGPAYVEMAMAAVQAGQDIPAALAPIIRELTLMGELTEAQAAALLGMAADAGPSWQSMEAAASKYEIKLDTLGQRFNQLKSNDFGETLAADFQMLLEGGASTESLLAGMGDEINKFAQGADSLGLTIPASMKPVLESMAEQGMLTDAAGNKLGDLSHIKFADPIISEVDKLIAKLDELIAKIGSVPGMLSGSLGDVAPPIENPIPADVMHQGGMIWRKAHKGMLLGSRLRPDEVPIIGQTGERMLSRTELAALGGPAGVNAAIAGGGRGLTMAGVEARLDHQASETRAMRADMNRMMLTFKSDVIAAMQTRVA